MVRHFKVGGIRFLRVHRLQLSFCVCRNSTMRKPAHRQLSQLRASEDIMCSHDFTPRRDPVEDALMAFSVTCCVMAFCAHLFERVNAKLDLMFQVLAARLDELEGRVGDRNSGFVEGYLLRHTPDASVVPLAPRIARRGAGEG